MAVSPKKLCKKIVGNHFPFTVMCLDSNESECSIIEVTSKWPTPATPQYSDSVWYTRQRTAVQTADPIRRELVACSHVVLKKR